MERFWQTSDWHVQQKAVPIHLLIIHCFISLQLFAKYKWSYHFITTQVIFRHFFSVGIVNELLQVCYNFNYLIQCTKFDINIFMECNVFYNWGYVPGSRVRRILNCKCIEFFAVQHIAMLTYRSLTIYFIFKNYERL